MLSTEFVIDQKQTARLDPVLYWVNGETTRWIKTFYDSP